MQFYCTFVRQQNNSHFFSRAFYQFVNCKGNIFCLWKFNIQSTKNSKASVRLLNEAAKKMWKRICFLKEIFAREPLRRFDSFLFFFLNILVHSLNVFPGCVPLSLLLAHFYIVYVRLSFYLSEFLFIHSLYFIVAKENVLGFFFLFSYRLEFLHIFHTMAKWAYIRHTHKYLKTICKNKNK